MIRYTVVTGWRSPADGVAGLGGLTVQAHCLSGYSHYSPPQPPAQLSPNQTVILWLALENGNGARARSYCWRDIPTCTLEYITTVGSDTGTSLYVHAVGFSTGWVRDWNILQQ